MDKEDRKKGLAARFIKKFGFLKASAELAAEAIVDQLDPLKDEVGVDVHKVATGGIFLNYIRDNDKEGIETTKEMVDGYAKITISEMKRVALELKKQK